MARLRQSKTFSLNEGDPVLMGKYKNSPGRIEGFGITEKGDPTIKVRMRPKGDRGQGALKEVNLFKVRYDQEQAERDQQVDIVANRFLQAMMRTVIIEAGGKDITKRIPQDSLPLVFGSEVAEAVLRSRGSVRIRLASVASEYHDFYNVFAAEVVRHSKLKLGQTSTLWLAWRRFYTAGRNWGAVVIDKHAIPPKMAKPVEMAVRLFSKNYPRGKSPDIFKWYETNRKRFDLLDEARDWPLRTEEEGAIVPLGPFNFHDTVHAKPAVIAKVRQHVEKAVALIRRSNVPQLASMLYGDLYLVGQLARSSWAAWYVGKVDSIYLRATNKNPDATRHIIHEIGHRYWLKKLSPSTRKEWMEYHTSLESSVPRAEMPKVGDVLPIRVNNKKAIVSKIEGMVEISDAATGKRIGEVSPLKVLEWIRDYLHAKQFPSAYARRDSEEHFCEALSFYVMGDLTGAGLEAFERIVIGGRSRRAAESKFKNKKTVKTEDGKDQVVYEYSERQVQHRHREKAKKVEKLRGDLSRLREQITKDLKSKDEKTRQTALVVGLMNDTFERVGNETSAEEGHFGVTGWQARHVSIRDGKATISYVGKSGVKQTKVTSDAGLVGGLKELLKGKSGKDSLFEGVSASTVNEYLKPFDITAKDIRGLHANREMQERLKAIRSKGGDLPKDKGEREKKLKDEFKQALEEAAEAVGHEAATLRSQYLVPGLEDNYLRDGTVKKKLDKQGTKGKGEKEDEEAERLLDRNPTKKPPRHDLRRERAEDTDTKREKPGADTDRDLSTNYKRVAGEGKRKPGDVWQAKGGQWVAMSPKGVTHSFGKTERSKEQAEAFAQGLAEKGEDTEKAVAEKKRRERQEKAKAERESFRQEAQELLETLDSIPDSVKETVQGLITSNGEGNLQRAFRQSQKAMMAQLERGVTVEMLRDARKDPFRGVDLQDPDALAQALVQTMVRDRLILNPSSLGGRPLSSEPLSEEDRVNRALLALKHYRHVSTAQRKQAAEKAAQQLAALPADSPERSELNAIIDGMHAAAALHNEPFEAKNSDGGLLREPLNEKLRDLMKVMVRQGTAGLLFQSDSSKLYEAEGREVIRDALGELDDHALSEMTKGTPWAPLGELLESMDISPEIAEYVRALIRDFGVNAMTTIQGMAAAIARKKPDASNPTEVYAEVANELTSALDTDVVRRFLDDCLASPDVVDCFDAKRDQVLRAQMESAVGAAVSYKDPPEANDVPFAVARMITEGAAPSVADEPWERELSVEERRRKFIRNLEDPAARRRVREMTVEEFLAMEGKQ